MIIDTELPTDAFVLQTFTLCAGHLCNTMKVCVIYVLEQEVHSAMNDENDKNHDKC